MVSVSVTKAYFEPKTVQKAVDRAAPATLRAAGAYVRAIARNSIRSIVNPNVKSPVGTPPHHHTYLKKSILFGVDPDGKVAVVGPAILHGTQSANAARAHEVGGYTEIWAGDPRLLNGAKIGDTGPVRASRMRRNALGTPMGTDPLTGGTVYREVLRTKTQAEAATRLYARMLREHLVGRRMKIRYPRRPYMNPALYRGAPKLSRFWLNAVKP